MKAKPPDISAEDVKYGRLIFPRKMSEFELNLLQAIFDKINPDDPTAEICIPADEVLKLLEASKQREEG